VIAGMQVGMRMLSSTDSLTGESAVAQRILSDAGYEHAYALTDPGASLRRGNRRAEARDVLRAGLELMSKR
jgi:hypothetical protein